MKALFHEIAEKHSRSHVGIPFGCDVPCSPLSVVVDLPGIPKGFVSYFWESPGQCFDGFSHFFLGAHPCCAYYDAGEKALANAPCTSPESSLILDGRCAAKLFPIS